MVEPHLNKNICTNQEIAISAKEKLAASLEYFACGTLKRHIASIYRISKQHYGVIIEQVCDAIIEALKPQIPSLCEEGLLESANSFMLKWNFPNCVGAIDGKHVRIRCPNNGGSLFYNYKGFHSVILMAVADANYKFTFIDVGAHGSAGDAAVFAKCQLGNAIKNNEIKFPEEQSVGGTKIPFFFVADDAFPLGQHIMKPYIPKKSERLTDMETVFNYRLSRASICVENAFGILSSRWHCFIEVAFLCIVLLKKREKL